MWTDEDLVDLAKYMKKYPAGTSERWDKIAEALNRTVTEVTHFAKKIKDNPFKPTYIADQEEGVAVPNEEEVAERKKEKTKGGRNLKNMTESDNQENGDKQIAGSSGWTQKQQKSLETALACYTKGSSERWERIAKAVPEKTKEECMLRVKYLSEMVKKKKQSEEEAKQASEQISDDQPPPKDHR